VQLGFRESVENGKKYETSDSRQIKFERLLMEWICLDKRPFAAAQGEGFQALIGNLDGRLTIPAVSTLSRSKLPALFKYVMEKVTDQINQDKPDLQSVGFTSDLWTSRCMEAYMSLTCGYINSQFKITNWTLACVPFPERHTGENIALKTDQLVSKFDFPEDCERFITTDSAASMVLAAKESSEITHGTKCACHKVNLAIKDAFESAEGMSNVVQVCKKLTSYTHQSTLGNNALKNQCEKTGKKYRKLIQPVETRWNSQCMCLESVLYLKEELQSLSLTDAKFSDLCPSRTQFELISGASELLSGAKIMSEKFSSENQPTVCCVLPLLYDYMESLKVFRLKVTNNGRGKMFAKELINCFKERFPMCGSTTVEFAIGNLLDPRYQGCHLKLFPESYNCTIQLLKDQVVEQTIFRQNSGSSSQSSEPEETPSQKLLKQSSRAGSSSSSEQNSSFESELDKYFAVPKIPFNTCANEILNWWKLNALCLPHLSQLVRKYFAIPVSSAASERLFSSSGNIVNIKRTSLLPQNVEMLVLVSENLKRLKKMNLY
jgi:hypothetical protein